MSFMLQINYQLKSEIQEDYFMQYEEIILELLSRIKKLENEVDEIKSSLTLCSTVPATTPSNETESENSSRTAYTKTTAEMIEMCYKSGKKMRDGENPNDLADDIAEATGMNRNSALMYLYAVCGMLEGTIYKRAISAKALNTYMRMISNEYGSKGLKKAITATREHIRYRHECGHTVDSIEEICNRYDHLI